jgi:hypothetical protein
MTILRVFLALAALVLGACNSSAPTTADMDRFYREAEKQAQRDIDRLTVIRNRGEISADEYQRRETAIKDSIPRRASEMAWTRHELTESTLRGRGIPTPEAPVEIAAPGRGGGGTNSFYRQPGQSGPGYQGTSAGISGGYLPSALTTSGAAALRN